MMIGISPGAKANAARSAAKAQAMCVNVLSGAGATLGGGGTNAAARAGADMRQAI